MHNLIRAVCVGAALIVGCTGVDDTDPVLAGVWQVTFQVDTTHPGVPDQFTGSIAIRQRAEEDTAFVGAEPEMVGTSITDPQAIAHAGPSPEEAERLGLPAQWWRDTYVWTAPGDSVRIRINPYGSSGGIELSGRVTGSKIVGSWRIPGEPPLALGKFSMIRVVR